MIYSDLPFFSSLFSSSFLYTICPVVKWGKNENVSTIHVSFFFFHFGDGHPLSSFLHVNKSLAMFPVDQRRLKWNHSVRKPHSNTREGHESLSYESEKMYYQSSSSTSVYKQREANVSCFYSFYGQFEDFRDWTKKSCPNSKDLVNIDSVWSNVYVTLRLTLAKILNCSGGPCVLNKNWLHFLSIFCRQHKMLSS